jgi:hypothetical protein
MPVRGTTEWRHAIIQKKVINLDHDGNRNIMCAWSYCEKDGYEMYKIRVRDSAPGESLKYINYVFCSQDCKEHWIDELTKIKHARER